MQRYTSTLFGAGVSSFRNVILFEFRRRKVGDLVRKSISNKGKKFSIEYRNKLSESSTVKLKVNQLDLNGNLIKIWDSISLAQKTLQIRHISEVCRGDNNNKTSGGYRWEYHN